MSVTERAGELFVGVDLGGTRTRAALFELDSGRMVGKVVTATPTENAGESVIENLCATVREVVGPEARWGGTRPVRGIVVGSPGPLDVATGTVLHAPLFQGQANIPLRSRIREAFGVETWVENDANLAALGEHTCGAGRDSAVMVYVGIGTGIGGGLVVGGKLLTGAHGFAGELGHICVEPDGPFCGCGRRGCVETYASGKAMEAEALRAVHQGVVTRLAGVAEAGGSIRVEDIVRLAGEGDEVANAILERAARMLGVALGSVVNLLNPDRVVVGGGVSRAGGAFVDRMRDAMLAQAMSPMCEQVTVARSELGDEAGLYGAWSYGRQKLFEGELR